MSIGDLEANLTKCRLGPAVLGKVRESYFGRTLKKILRGVLGRDLPWAGQLGVMHGVLASRSACRCTFIALHIQVWLCVSVVRKRVKAHLPAKPQAVWVHSPEAVSQQINWRCLSYRCNGEKGWLLGLPSERCPEQSSGSLRGDSWAGQERPHHISCLLVFARVHACTCLERQASTHGAGGYSSSSAHQPRP